MSKDIRRGLLERGPAGIFTEDGDFVLAKFQQGLREGSVELATFKQALK